MRRLRLRLKAAIFGQPKGGDIWSTHHDIGDFSLYTKFTKFKKLPIEAVVPVRSSESIVVTEPRPVGGYYALFNEAIGEVMPVRPVSESYNLVSHDKLFEQQAQVLFDSDLPTGGNVEVVDRLYDAGTRAHRTVYFHDLAAGISDGRDVVRCRIDVFNSVDMSWAFQVFSGAYRDLCRNTLVFGGSKAYQQKARHTPNLSVDGMMTKAALGLAGWSGQVDQMRVWQNTPMSGKQFADILSMTLCRKENPATEAGLVNPVNETKLNYLLQLYLDDVQELGNTAWTAYNALTHWSTHTNHQVTTDEGKSLRAGKDLANHANVRRVRGEAVRQVIESPYWQEVMAA
jgi:hypothetical protein